MVNFFQTESEIGLPQIEDIEKYVELKFPEEYKAHLLKNNGGQCFPNIFKFNENGKTSTSSIDWFLAIYDGEYDSMIEYINDYKVEDKRLPQHILPIAHDPGGNLICISCGGDDNGYIYFWDHENEVDYNESSDSDYRNLFLISKSFSEFIDQLTE